MARRLRVRSNQMKAIRDIEVGLRSLGRGLRSLAKDLGQTGDRVRPAAPRRVSAALRLQGRYMGLIRNLPARKKARVMAIRASKGVEQAIRAAREFRA